jgi:hypothetical protein
VNAEPAIDRAGPRFWIGLLAGTGVMLWGVRLFLDAVPDSARRTSLVVWIVGADLVHDLVVAPLILVLAWVSGRVGPRWLRSPLQVGLMVSGAVVVVGALPLLGSAEAAGNPTIQPLDYRSAVATALGIVWAAVAIWAGARWAAARRRPG